MKKYVLKKCMKLVKKSCPNYNDEKLLEIEYGLEGMYLSLSKTIVIFLIAYIIGILTQMILLFLFYSLIRSFGFGIHANKSWICWVSSLIIFIGLTILAININFTLEFKIILLFISICSFYFYAPADTYKHPLINIKKRKYLKLITLIISFIYSFICLYTSNSVLSNIILFSLLAESFMIWPLSYKIFNVPYNNYKLYNS